MKRAVLLTAAVFLALAGLLALAGCGNGTETTPSTTTTTGSPTGATTPPSTQDLADNWAPDGVLSEGEYTGEFSSGNYLVRWFVHEDTAYFGVRAQTDGWVALGIQPGEAMQDADIIIGFVDDSGADITDQFSTGFFGPHSPDTELGGQDNILESGGGTADGATVIEFSRRLDTGDDFDNPLSSGDNQIIWSYGSTDDTGRQHTVRGGGEITLN